MDAPEKIVGPIRVLIVDDQQILRAGLGLILSREDGFEVVGEAATTQEAMRLANDSAYGLSGSIWTRDIAVALRMVRGVRAGVLSVNSTRSVHVEAPFGGFKSSGIGRELGMRALDLYTEVKNVFIALD